MNHPKAKFLTICGPVKLKPKLLTSKIQLWDRSNVRVTDIPISNGRKWKK